MHIYIYVYIYIYTYTSYHFGWCLILNAIFIYPFDDRSPSKMVLLCQTDRHIASPWRYGPLRRWEKDRGKWMTHDIFHWKIDETCNFSLENG